MAFYAGILFDRDNVPEPVAERLRSLVEGYVPAIGTVQRWLDAEGMLLFQQGPAETTWNGRVEAQDGPWIWMAHGKDFAGGKPQPIVRVPPSFPDIIPGVMDREASAYHECNYAMVGVNLNSRQFYFRTDPLGTAPLAYYRGDGFLVFSSHPSLIYRLCEEIPPDENAIFELLLAGHLFGNKTLYGQVSLLPPGGELQGRGGNLVVGRYYRFEQIPEDFKGTPQQAADMIWDRLLEILDVFEHRGLMFDCMLSGGWDSRFLTGWLNTRNLVRCTWTVENRGAYLETLIAAQCADFLGVENRQVTPALFSQSADFSHFARVVDYRTDLGPWLTPLLDEMPVGINVVDGHMLDVLLRPDWYLPRQLINPGLEGNPETVAEYFLDLYLEQGGPYAHLMKAGGARLKALLEPDYYNQQADIFRETIRDEFSGELRVQDLAAVFNLKNRQHHGIAPRISYQNGNQRTAFIPFCDVDLLQKCLSIPPAMRSGGALLEILLEKVKPGLSQLVSTNSPPEQVGPFLRRRSLEMIARKVVYGSWLYWVGVLRAGENVKNHLKKPDYLYQLLRFPYQIPRFLLIQKAFER